MWNVVCSEDVCVLHGLSYVLLIIINIIIIILIHAQVPRVA